jgi:hypothetical protein
LQFNKYGFIIGNGTRDNKTDLDYFPVPEMHDTILAVHLKGQLMLWHQRLAQVNMCDLTQVHKYANGVTALKKISDVCRYCRLGKAHKISFVLQKRVLLD